MVDQKYSFSTIRSRLHRDVALPEQIQGRSFSEGHYFLHAKGN